MSKLEIGGNLNSSLFTDFEIYQDDFSVIENEDPVAAQSISQEILSWDTFKYFPPQKESTSIQKKGWLDISIHVIKIFSYCIIFCTVLCSSLIAKCAVLFSIAQLEEKNSVQYCDYYSDYDKNMKSRISKEGRVIWTWYIIFMFLVPECIDILKAIWNGIFKNKEKMPKIRSIAILFFLETLHPIGLALLIFYSFPLLNSVDIAAVSSCIYFVPSLLSLFSQNQNYTNTRKMFILILLCNILALIAQGFGIILLFYLYFHEHNSVTWILPISLLLSSCRWWNNYISIRSCCGFIRFLAVTKMDLVNGHRLLQGGIAFWRSFIFILSAIVISIFKEIQITEFFTFLWKSTYNVELVEISNSSIFVNVLETSNYYFKETDFQSESISTALYTFLIQIFCTFLTYEGAKFAYQTQMHKFGFAFPISLTTPGVILLITMACVMRRQNVCAFHNLIPDSLFFKEPNSNNIKDFILSWRIWCWIIWWLSQIWITIQLWLGENERLAPAEKIFYNSTYDSLMIDQFLGLNKRRHEIRNIIDEEEEEEEDDLFKQFESITLKETHRSNESNLTLKESQNNKRNIYVTQIYACATMWHEKKEEMNELIGSILRLDKDQCALRVTQKYYKVFIKDYYELETHIFFDDAFCCMHNCSGSCDHNENEVKMNQYVVTFVETVQENIKSLGMYSTPPTKYPTPYGGQLVWILPGETRLIVHLKNKNKIRYRKRWSQVMYMYYLLGYRLMGSSMDVEQKELLAENTYILTLDGDVDFHPPAVKALVDFMKKDKELGAVCGRIHPTGEGPIIWCQKFEYAIGHWLQKSTEHIIGSVLCSPGCFSLFRAKALMQHNVLAKYAIKATEPRHYIQYDQGEDRWLCTLILQAGGKVEYCAASDAYTHAPESFKEFYIQRRRWISSTTANIFDLLNTSKKIRKVNNNISWPYILYQWSLIGSTIIGPSFIYLMMAGAFIECFHLDNWTSFWLNMIPIGIFLVTCFFCEENVQITAAEIMTIIYSLVMIIVLVGMILQVAAQGYFAPNTLLFFIVFSQFLLTGLMHPREWSCLKNGIIYYITVPSMYMLLIIFSIFNVHNVTWGTRESKVSKTESAKIMKPQSEQNTKEAKNKWTKFSLANLFKYDSHLYKNSRKHEQYLNLIYNSINEINIRLEQIESTCRIANTTKENIEEKYDKENKIYNKEIESEVTEDKYEDADLESVISVETSTSSHQKYSNYLISPYWLQDECIKNGKVDFLSSSDEEFWNQLIEKYLYPIENDVKKQQDIKKGLMNIRNECLLKFFTINILFIVAIFLLQINKNVLYLHWPLSINYNITYIEESNEVHIFKEYMHLEPIGCLFILAFVIIMLIQFLAMFVHRFSTFTHVLANVKLKLACCGKNLKFFIKLHSNFQEKYSSITNKHVKCIAEGLQSAVETEMTLNLKNNTMPYSSQRKIIRELVEDSHNAPKMNTNLETLFHKKLSEPTFSGSSKAISLNIPEDAIEVLESRRSKFIANCNKLQFQKGKSKINSHEVSNLNINKESKELKNHEYDNPIFLNDNND